MMASYNYIPLMTLWLPGWETCQWKHLWNKWLHTGHCWCRACCEVVRDDLAVHKLNCATWLKPPSHIVDLCSSTGLNFGFSGKFGDKLGLKPRLKTSLYVSAELRFQTSPWLQETKFWFQTKLKLSSPVSSHTIVMYLDRQLSLNTQK